MPSPSPYSHVGSNCPNPVRGPLSDVASPIVFPRGLQRVRLPLWGLSASGPLFSADSGESLRGGAGADSSSRSLYLARRRMKRGRASRRAMVERTGNDAGHGNRCSASAKPAASPFSPSAMTTAGDSCPSATSSTHGGARRRVRVGRVHTLGGAVYPNTVDALLSHNTADQLRPSPRSPDASRTRTPHRAPPCAASVIDRRPIRTADRERDDVIIECCPPNLFGSCLDTPRHSVHDAGSRSLRVGLRSVHHRRCARWHGCGPTSVANTHSILRRIRDADRR